MNVLGEKLTVVGSRDPTKLGVAGLAVLETERTILLHAGRKVLRVEKLGTAFQLARNGSIVAGDDIFGRLEDRLGRRKK